MSPSTISSILHCVSRSNNWPGACVGGVGEGGQRTVKKLRLSKALTIPEGISISDACRRMAHRRVDAVLLTDSNAMLSSGVGGGGERTVKKLRLSKALTIPEGINVSDACRRMAIRNCYQ